jgi:hypothetical protein
MNTIVIITIACKCRHPDFPSHLVQYRGQVSVYLRLLEVPVPGSYGPADDELTTPSRTTTEAD